ncbi:Rieske (2Fe-2S) protein [Thalassospiraceae bacterium LMO-JJ14]|nr:Rieske (2Fe-2S) protein [Thalassospiraceae bacterium LMO-JJ14]
MNRIVNERSKADWVHALDVAELNGKPKVVKLDGRQLVLFKSGNDIFACNNRCPHEGYPLSEGVLSDGCILTCNWHNWKFDLRSGATIVGGDRLRRYPVKVHDGHVYVDVADPPPGDIVEDSITDLLDSFDDHDYTRMAREIARIIKADGNPLDAVTATLKETYDRFEYGMTHAVAAAADWLALYSASAGEPARQLTCITEIVGHMAWDTRRQTSFPYAGSMQAFNANVFLRAIELQDEDTAISHMRGALCAGYEFDDLYEYLARSALSHYQDFGHSLIYVLKSRQFVRRTEGHTLEQVLFMLVRALIYATREDLIPQFKAYRQSLANWTDGEGEPDKAVLREGGVSEVLSEIQKCSGDPMACYNALYDAAAWQMLHMDIDYSLSTSGPVQDNVGWLDFTHALTFANAVRIICSDFPDLWPQGLLQIGCFLGRNAKYTDKTQDTSQWRVDDPLTFARSARDGVIDHGQFEYIVAAHMLKLSHAIVDEIEAQPDAPWTATAAAALNRFLNSPLKRKHALRTARQAMFIVERED